MNTRIEMEKLEFINPPQTNKDKVKDPMTNS